MERHVSSCWPLLVSHACRSTGFMCLHGFGSLTRKACDCKVQSGRGRRELLFSRTSMYNTYSRCGCRDASVLSDADTLLSECLLHLRMF